MSRHLPLLLALALPATAGTAADRALESRHQPVVQGNRAVVPGCPDWSSSANGNSEANASNFGCATASNLAAMVADPMDLLRGRAAGPLDASSADYATRAIKAWHDMPASSKQWSVTTAVSSKGGS